MSKRKHGEDVYNINEEKRLKEKKKKKKKAELNSAKRHKERMKRIEKEKKQKNKVNLDDNLEFQLDNDVVFNMIDKNKKKKEVEKKSKNTQKKNKNKSKVNSKIKNLLKVVVILIVLGVLIAFAFTSPIFQISKVEVINNGQVSIETIISLSGLVNGQNIFNYNSKEIEDKILTNSYIDEVEISRKLPDTVEINIKERESAFAIKLLDKYVYINTQGYIIDIFQTNDKNHIVLNGYTTDENAIVIDERLSVEDLEKITDVLKITNAAKDSGILEKITSIDITDENEYIIYSESEQKQIYIGNVLNLNQKMLYILVMFENEVGIKGEIFVNGDFDNQFKPFFREDVSV